MLDTRLKPLLEVKDVCQSYLTGSGETGALVLDHVSLTLKEGEIVGLLGRSGSGKSSLLRIISGLAKPTSGEVTFRGEPVRGPFEEIAMVFQSAALVSVAFRSRQCRTWPQGQKSAGERSPLTRVESDRPHRPRRFRIGLSEGIVGRHAPARRLCPRARGQPQHSPDGRALFGARRAHGGNASYRPPRSLGRRPHADQIDIDGHP